MKQSWVFFAAGIVVAGMLYTLTSSMAGVDSLSQNNVNNVNEGNLPHNTYLPSVPDEYELFGEKMPLERADVYESFDREILTNTFWHTNLILVLKRSAKYFPIIEPILKENNVPEDFKYLAVAESALVPTVKSPAGAVGFWQIMDATGKELGLEINDEVDQRYDLVKSTNAACKMLKRSYESLGSWTLVAAAYNGGQTRVNKNRNNQHQDSYYDVLWSEETARYVFRIAAFKLIMSEPSKYGFNISESDYYELGKTRIEQVDGSIADIAQYAIDNGTTYKALKTYNPWLRQNKLTNARRRTYDIVLPEKE